MTHLRWFPLLPAALVVVAAGCMSAHKSTATATTSSSTLTTSSTVDFPATTSPEVSAGGPLPRGFLVADLTWVSDTQGWALGSAPCAVAPCTSVAHTLDGGRSWAGLPAPVADIEGAEQPIGSCSATVACVQGIRFADAYTGYAFGLSSLWLTADGGHTWVLRSRDTTDALEVDGAMVVRVTSPNYETPPDLAFQVQEAAVGSTSWHTVLPSTVQGDGVFLAVQGPNLYLAVLQNPAGGAQNAQPTWYRSTNSGSSWSTRSDPCGNAPDGVEADTSAITAAPGGYLAVGCTPRQADDAGYVVISADAGATFGPQRGNLLNPKPALEEFYSIAAPTGSRLLVMIGTFTGTTIVVSNDGGLDWSVAHSETGNASRHIRGFEDATTGRAILSGATILTTTDGGGHWAPYTFAT